MVERTELHHAVIVTLVGNPQIAFIINGHVERSIELIRAFP